TAYPRWLASFAARSRHLLSLASERPAGEAPPSREQTRARLGIRADRTRELRGAGQWRSPRIEQGLPIEREAAGSRIASRPAVCLRACAQGDTASARYRS